MPRALVGAVALTAVLASGCGSSDNDSTSTSGGSSTSASTTTSGKTVAPKIAILDIVYSDFQQAQEKGIVNAVQKYGGSFKTFNANYDPSKQLQQCKDAITSGRFNAIVLGVLDPATGVPCVAAAKAAGLPVVAQDTAIGTDPNDLEPQVDGVVGGVYATPQANAQSNVDLVTKACQGIDPCKVIAEIATPTDPMSNDAVAAVSKIPNVKIVGKFASQFDPGTVAQKMPDLLSANPDVNVFLSIADSSALAALPAIKQAGLDGKIKLIGDGGSVAGAQAIKDGTLWASTGNWPIQEGEILGEMVHKALNGQEIDPKGMEQDDIDKPQVLDKSTIDQFKAEWGAGS